MFNELENNSSSEGRSSILTRINLLCILSTSSSCFKNISRKFVDSQLANFALKLIFRWKFNETSIGCFANSSQITSGIGSSWLAFSINFLSLTSAQLPK